MTEQFQPTRQALAELARVPAVPHCCLHAEIGAALRIAGADRAQARATAVVADFAGYGQAARLRTAIAAAFGCRLEIRVRAGTGAAPRHELAAGTGGQAEELIRTAKLVDPAGRPLVGMPQPVVAGRRCDCAAGWRGAFLAAGALCAPARSRPFLTVDCPTRETALALAGTARRIGVPARMREFQGGHQAVVGGTDDIVVILTRIGGPETAIKWEKMRASAEAASEASARGYDSLGGSNLTRSMHAAAQSAARARRALEILGDDAPGYLVDAGRLRIANPETHLFYLGQLADPPLSKDTIAGRLRRLNALADAHAARLGVPDTASALTALTAASRPAAE
jgi:DNA-binding protein WhiA